MNKLANRLAEKLVNNGADLENVEIYAYAIECLLNTTFIFSILLILGAIFSRFLITLFWIIFFLPIRHHSGGLHASNHIGCVIFSVSIGTLCMFAASWLSSYDWIIYVGLVLSIAIIFAFAPVIHSNHPLSEEKIQRTKKAARIIILIETALVLIMHFLMDNALPFAALLGILSSTISTLIGHFHKQ